MASSNTPSTPRSAAAGRIGKRYKELLETECTLCDDMDQLIATLTVASQDKTWNLRPEHVQLIQRTCSSVSELVRVHSSIRERMAMFACPDQLAGTFQIVKDELVTVHGEFQTLSTCVMVVLQKRAGGQVIGDRAVGTTVKSEGSLAAALAPIQDLLVRPSQRVMKYGLFLDEMAADARRSEQLDLEANLQQTGQLVRGVAADINERIRGIQRRERVQMIAARVRAVPSGVSIIKPGREFVLDDGNFREMDIDTSGRGRGRAGYRHLYLFSDALLVCKPGENLLRQVFSSKSKDQDLKFKRLISLNSIKPSEYPCVCEPPAACTPDSPESPGSMQTLPYFELRDGIDKCAFYHTDREKVVEWVAAIHAAILGCEKARTSSDGPVPAYRLPNSTEDMALLSQDLSGLDLSKYVLFEMSEPQTQQLTPKETERRCPQTHPYKDPRGEAVSAVEPLHF